jgi:hypothetical protein
MLTRSNEVAEAFVSRLKEGDVQAAFDGLPEKLVQAAMAMALALDIKKVRTATRNQKLDPVVLRELFEDGGQLPGWRKRYERSSAKLKMHATNRLLKNKMQEIHGDDWFEAPDQMPSDAKKRARKERTMMNHQAYVMLSDICDMPTEEQGDKIKCGVCLDTGTGVKCTMDGMHGVCSDCVPGWVSSCCGIDQCSDFKKAGGIWCPTCKPRRVCLLDRDKLYKLTSQEDVSKIIDANLKAKEGEVVLETRNAVEREHTMPANFDAAIARLGDHLHSLLLQKCPDCQLVYTDYSHCSALTCRQCAKSFCGICNEPCASAFACHRHVETCIHNQNPVDAEGLKSYYLTEEVQAASTKAWRLSVLRQYVDDDDPARVQQMRQIPRMKQILDEFGITEADMQAVV